MNPRSVRSSEHRKATRPRPPATTWAATLVALGVVGLSLVWALQGSVVAEGTRPAAVWQGTATISGTVIDDEGDPIADATVRIQATTNSTLSATDGTFTLGGLTEASPVTVSAWKHTYYCAKVEGVTPPAAGITLTLIPYQTDDNPGYEWMPPFDADPEAETCGHCKPGVTAIWLENAHAGAGTNPRFFSMYNGTDVGGTGEVLPGYVQDYPGTTGNCATCHAPGAGLDAPYSTDMNALTGADTFGVHCDFCHKVADLYLNPATGLPYPNAPGALSMDVRRPYPESEQYQLFFGTFDDDNVPEEDSYLPLIEESAFCAPCHQFSFWGTPIYQSFREWLESPYPGFGVECQTCHMPSDETMTNVAPGKGGVERDPLTIHAHTQPGAADEELLQQTVSMTLSADPGPDGVQVTVTITNTRAGHHVPTDYPGRNMILVVSATDSEGNELAQRSGGVVPDWGGTGVTEDDYAGRAGKGFAKILRDAETGMWPVVSYWKQSFIHSDNRIAARAADVSHYEFGRPQSGEVRVQAKLWFRRLFIEQARAKGWDTPDILMAQAQASVPAVGDRPLIFLPVITKR
jgi:hypothetical protein